MFTVIDHNAIHHEIDRLAAPSRSGEILLWPAVETWSHVVMKNFQKRRSYSFELCGRAYSEWVELGATPQIASGHQPDLFHPGVWIKNILVNALAQRLQADARMLVVDADAPTAFKVEYPLIDSATGELAQHHHRLQHTATGQPYECMTNISAADYEALLKSLSASAGSDASVIAAFRDAFLHATPSDYVSRWQAGIAALDRSFGIGMPRFQRISERFDVSNEANDAAGAFAVDILVRAETFHRSYNQALTRYRRLRGMRGTRHPMPDLDRHADRIELPFWLHNSCHLRNRLWVESRDDRLSLFADDRCVGVATTQQLSADPRRALSSLLGDWQLRPRAIPQTAYYRLFECDLFIHGIGGAKYDAITDALIADFWKIDPPSYACASATLRLPLPRSDDAERKRAVTRRRLRDLRFNPQRLLTAAQRAECATLLTKRQTAIDNGRMLAANDRKNRAARRKVFEEIRRINAEIALLLPDEPEKTRRRIESLNAQMRQDAIADQREWFVGLYPRSDLEQLSQRAKAAIAAVPLT